MPVGRCVSRANKVLVVEDHPVNRLVITSMLARLGCKVDVAEDGAQSVSACRNTHYDLILMDLQMPVMDGFEATTQIRAMSTNAKEYTPIVAVTANSTEGVKEQCFSVGMDEFHTKPLGLETLNAILKRTATMARA